LLSIEVENRIRQMNPWIVHPEKAAGFLDRFIPREYVHRAVEATPFHSNRALLIVGPRQSGKSTMAWHMLKDLAPDVLFLNMEDPLLRTGCDAPIDFAEFIRENFSNLKALFIDEIQHMDEGGLFIKGLVDAHLGIPLLVIGSSSFDLRSKTRESLTGRATRRLLMPFSITEMMKCAAPQNPLASRHIFEQIFTNKLVFGSYPSVYLSPGQDEKLMLLSDLVESLILRDASDMFRIKRIDAFRKLLTLLAGQIGNLVSYSELASICNIDVGTLNAYIEILEESHIVKRVRPFAGGKRREIIGAPKVFFLDNGIRNQLLTSFSRQLSLRTDKGQLLENWVFAEIYKTLPIQSSVKFWRSKAKAEVDFVIEHGGGIFGLEVKFSSLKAAKVSRSSWSFIEAYHPQKFAVLNLTLEQRLTARTKEIHFLTPRSLFPWLGSIFLPDSKD
jgi:predicted AAA+ superfamily ATPase